MVTIGCGGLAQIALKTTPDKNFDSISISFAWGFAVFIGLILSSNVSGFLNPAITLSYYVLKKLNFIQFLVLTLGQYIGRVLM